VAKLDTAWATAEIDAFLYVTERIPSKHTNVLGLFMRGPQTEASERAHVVEQILDRALPGWSKDRPAKDPEYRWLRDQASRGRAASK
jgi:hypothetical protein